jgi:hypothetical protein
MRYIFASFMVWILIRKRLGVYSDLVTNDAKVASPKGDRVVKGAP